MSPLPWPAFHSELRNPTAGAGGHKMSPLTRLRDDAEALKGTPMGALPPAIASPVGIKGISPQPAKELTV
jgi:hypothetical protein